MRTTLTIDDDILAIARAHAEREERSIGAVLSDMAREGMAKTQRAGRTMQIEYVDGLPTLPAAPGGRKVTPDDVRQLLDDLP
jgi:hypothetical protein